MSGYPSLLTFLSIWSFLPTTPHPHPHAPLRHSVLYFVLCFLSLSSSHIFVVKCHKNSATVLYCICTVMHIYNVTAKQRKTETQQKTQTNKQKHNKKQVTNHLQKQRQPIIVNHDNNQVDYTHLLFDQLGFNFPLNGSELSA